MKQTFLVKYIEDGKMIDFYRYNLKTLNGVLNRGKHALASCYSGIDKNSTSIKIVVYETDYETTDDKIVYKNTIKGFME